MRRKSPTREKSTTLSSWRIGALAVAVVSGLTTVGCATSGSYVWVNELPEASIVAPPVTTVAVGDVLSIRVFGQDSLAVRAAVRPDRTLTVPLIGQVAVLGRSTDEISKEIEKRLEPFFTSPRVSTVIEETRIRVVVAGEVVRPGTLEIPGPIDLLTAIANSGGLTEFAGETELYVLRRVGATTHRIRFRWEEVSRGEGNAARFRLRDNDEVVVE